MFRGRGLGCRGGAVRGRGLRVGRSGQEAGPQGGVEDRPGGVASGGAEDFGRGRSKERDQCGTEEKDLVAS